MTSLRERRIALPHQRANQTDEFASSIQSGAIPIPDIPVWGCGHLAVDTVLTGRPWLVQQVCSSTLIWLHRPKRSQRRAPARGWQPSPISDKDCVMTVFYALK